MDKKSVAQENPYDARGRANRAGESHGQGVIRSLSKISHYSYNSEAAVNKRTKSGVKVANTQELDQSRKLEGEAYLSGSHYFKSEARR